LENAVPLCRGTRISLLDFGGFYGGAGLSDLRKKRQEREGGNYTGGEEDREGVIFRRQGGKGARIRANTSKREVLLVIRCLKNM